jgi:hypothetical protein
MVPGPTLRDRTELRDLCLDGSHSGSFSARVTTDRLCFPQILVEAVSEWEGNGRPSSSAAGKSASLSISIGVPDIFLTEGDLARVA